MRRSCWAASGLSSRLATLQDGANQLADGSRKLADAVALLVGQTKKMGAGLNDASGFLMAMKYDATTPPMAGFYIPPQCPDARRLQKSRGNLYLARRTWGRYLVQTKLNPFSIAAMDQVNAILDTAHQAQPNTTLTDAKVSMAGISVGLRDTRDYYNKDFNFIIVTTVVIVFLILIGLLRAIIAPLYLICSVIVSYLSALGIGAIVFQFILGQELHWTVPGLTFIILVAVGADYNLLLISRIRDESPHGIRVGVIRTVGSTGGVITAAGPHFRGLDVRPAVRQHHHDGPSRLCPRHGHPAGHILGTHRDGAGDRHFGRPRELVAVTARRRRSSPADAPAIASGKAERRLTPNVTRIFHVDDAEPPAPERAVTHRNSTPRTPPPSEPQPTLVNSPEGRPIGRRLRR